MEFGMIKYYSIIAVLLAVSGEIPSVSVLN